MFSLENIASFVYVSEAHSDAQLSVLTMDVNTKTQPQVTFFKVEFILLYCLILHLQWYKHVYMHFINTNQDK